MTMEQCSTLYGGPKKRECGFISHRLPFNHCALSLQPVENPYCDKDGNVFDLMTLIPFINHFNLNPVTGQKLEAKDLTKLNFVKNLDGEYHCPRLHTVFGDNSHIVALKSTGNVFSFDAINEKEFSQGNLLTIQDPKNLEKFNVKEFHHLKLKKGYVLLRTSCGDITLELDCDQSPRTCGNFIGLCKKGYFDQANHQTSSKHLSGSRFCLSYSGQNQVTDPGSGSDITDQDDQRPGWILSMTNMRPESNHPQFFLTMGSYEELDEQHMIFGRVVGGIETLSNKQMRETEAHVDILIQSATVFVDPVINIEETKESVPNPLDNPLVLQHVLAYLKNARDLKNCRLVNTSWNSEAIKFFKKHSVIKISKEFLSFRNEDALNLKLLRELEEFGPQNLVMFYNPEPYHPAPTPYKSTRDWEVVKRFIKNVCDGLKSFNFPYTTVLDQQNRLQSFTELLQYSFRNLVQLTIGNSNFSWPNQPSLPPIPSLKKISWMISSHPPANLRPAKLKLVEGVFSLAPNLETLKLNEDYDFHDFGGQWPSVFLEHFNSKASSCPNLKELNLKSIHLQRLDVRALSTMKIKLRSLKLQLPFMSDYHGFEGLWRSQNETLEALQIAFPYVTNVPTLASTSFIFPCLPKLRKLKVVQEKVIGTSFRMVIDKVEYAKQFPVLQTLIIKYYDGGRAIKDRIWLNYPIFGALLPLRIQDLNREVCLTVRVLQLPPMDELQLNLEENQLFGIRERLSISFPNVRNKDVDIGRANVAQGLPYLPLEPVSSRTRSKSIGAPMFEN